MYYLEKNLEVSIAHKLNLGYDSPCNNWHGHNLKIKVYCRSNELDENGMVLDFTNIKKIIKEKIDHRNINEVFRIKNPTSEVLAKIICELIGEKCYRVEIEETNGNKAAYVNEG